VKGGRALARSLGIMAQAIEAHRPRVLLSWSSGQLRVHVCRVLMTSSQEQVPWPFERMVCPWCGELVNPPLLPLKFYRVR
jgi:hypothetical protein